MAIYRFKVTFEDYEEVYREIEIKSSQTFEEFHNIILKSIDFDGSADASFFISDDYWRKGEEIALRPSENKKEEAKRLMNKCKMAALIDDPHQKFVYVYDKNAHWSFMIELLKIVADDPKATYPKCAKTVGVAPKNTRMPIVAPAIVEDDDLDDEPHGDDDAYVNAHCEDGIAELGSEEGEEEEGTEEEEVGEEEENEFEDAGDEQFEED